MSTIYGNWAVTWSDSDHSGVNRQHQLRVPLQRIRPAVSVNKHTAVSLDFTVQDTVVFGSAYEIAAKIKAEDNTQSLADLLEAGMKGTTLTLVDLSQTDRTVDVYLIDPADAWLATYDMQGTPWEYEAELRFRRTSGTAFPDWLLYQAYGPTGLLFKYTAGMDLSGATFTRAAAANYINYAGATTAAATNVARDAHHCTVSSTWTRTLRLDDSDGDDLYFPFTHQPQALTVYLKFVEQGTVDGVGAEGVFTMGTTTNASPRFLVYHNGATNVYNVTHDNNTASVNETLSATHSVGDIVEIRACLYSDGAVQMWTSVNGAAESASAKSGAPSGNLAAAWQANNLYLNDFSGSAAGDMDVIDVKVAAGSGHSMAHMRSL